ncbi:hypothetical protein [Streptomyces sp. NPDC003077]|uniref:hypothetical protein n=1 Tax=Streptomyces sp. NPDC003077 TaxID=3154443 RepID=UPI0033B976F9
MDPHTEAPDSPHRPRAHPTGCPCHPSPYGNGHLLIDALLDDGELDVAWQAARSAPSGVADRQWTTLADRLRDSRPADVLPVDLRLIDGLKKSTGNAA